MVYICFLCGVSLETPVFPGDQNGVLFCGHMFHTRCLDNWWRTQLPPQLNTDRISQENMRTLQGMLFACPMCGSIFRGPNLRLLQPFSTPTNDVELRAAGLRAHLGQVATFVTQMINENILNYTEYVKLITGLFAAGGGPSTAPEPGPESAQGPPPGPAAGASASNVHQPNAPENVSSRQAPGPGPGPGSPRDAPGRGQQRPASRSLDGEPQCKKQKPN